MQKSKICFMFSALLLAATWSAAADETAEKGRAIFSKYQKSIVTLQIVVKSKISMSGMGGQSSEARQTLTGTIIDNTGLTVVSLSALDPGQMVQRLMGGGDRVKVETELSDLKILMDDGTELPAEVVLRDRDLDLGFVRPKNKPDVKFESVDLANSGKAEVLDSVVALNRLGNAAGRAYAASLERIAGVMQRPRLLYIPDTSATTSTLGSPGFTLDGKILGIFVMRALENRGGGSGMFSMQSDNVTGVIVPADYVLKAAKQAPAEAPPEEKTQPAATQENEK